MMMLSYLGYTGFSTSQIRYVRVRYQHTGLAANWQSPKLAPLEGEA